MQQRIHVALLASDSESHQGCIKLRAYHTRSIQTPLEAGIKKQGNYNDSVTDRPAYNIAFPTKRVNTVDTEEAVRILQWLNRRATGDCHLPR